MTGGTRIGVPGGGSNTIEIYCLFSLVGVDGGPMMVESLRLKARRNDTILYFLTARRMWESKKWQKAWNCPPH